MFAKLIGVLLLVLATTASAYDEPMEFQDVEAAKAWFKKAYPHSEMRKENVLNARKDAGVIYAFYGPRGSGIIRTEGWFYSCSPGYCGLIAMANLGFIKSEKEAPKLSIESGFLVVRSGEGIVLKVKPRPWK